MSIYLTAIVHVQPEHTEFVKQQMEQLVSQSRQERACLQYELHQGITDKNLFVFYEIWKDQKGLDTHNGQPFFLEYQSRVNHFFTEPPTIHYSKLVI